MYIVVHCHKGRFGEQWYIILNLLATLAKEFDITNY